MKKELIFSMASPFRDTFRIHGYRFGSGKKSLAIVGAMRGDEVQQQYICSQLVHRLAGMETEGRLVPGHEILVIPSANPFSMNIGKRFWAMDNTDINRMFPGYDKGETTQRIAAVLFEALQGYDTGIQMASFYIPGDFIPHVRITRTGYEDTEVARLFGFPYISLRTPTPFDTTLLNYNWQIWQTKAYSVYGAQNGCVEGAEVEYVTGSLMRLMHRLGLATGQEALLPDYKSQVVCESSFVKVTSPVAGILIRYKGARQAVAQGEVMARIIHPYEGHVMAEITAPVSGIVFFAHNKPLALQDQLLYHIIPAESTQG